MIDDSGSPSNARPAAIRDPLTTLSRIAAVAAAASLLGWLGVQIGLATLLSLWFDNVEFDGTFQLMNPMRRIAAGQDGGVDFQFFHGLGIPYLHYPLWVIFGRSVHAVEAARYLTTLVLFVGTTLAFFRASLGSWRLALFSMCAVVAGSGALWWLITPGNSLLGVRSSMPIVVGCLLMLQASPMRRGLAVGAALGLAVMLGTEQGAAILVAFVCVQLVRLLTARLHRDEVTFLGIALAVAAATIVVSFVAIGGVTGLRSALSFQFRAVPADQFWYFGVPPNLFLWDWSVLAVYPRVVLSFLVGVLFLLFMLGRAIRWPRAGDGFDWSAATLLAYGLIACYSMVGWFYPIYTAPLERVILLVGISVTVRWALPSYAWLRTLMPAVPSPTRLVPAAGMAAVIGLSLFGMMRTARYAGRNTPLAEAAIGELREGPNAWAPRLSRRVSGELAVGLRVVEDVEQQLGRTPRLWSLYAGLLEDTLAVFHPSVDYVIHALGPNARERYAEEFRQYRPDIVHTLRSRYFRWEEGLRQSHWNVYGELLRQYAVVDSTPRELYWRLRDDGPLPDPPVVAVELPRGGSQIPLPIEVVFDRDRVAEVSLEYELLNPHEGIPLFGQTPRYFVRVVETEPSADTTQLDIYDGIPTRILSVRGAIPVSLPPYKRALQFPVAVAAGTRPGLELHSFGVLPGVSIRATGIQLRVFELSARNRIMFLDPPCPSEGACGGDRMPRLLSQ